VRRGGDDNDNDDDDSLMQYARGKEEGVKEFQAQGKMYYVRVRLDLKRKWVCAEGQSRSEKDDHLT
jgi:hypothetical protein